MSTIETRSIIMEASSNLIVPIAKDRLTFSSRVDETPGNDSNYKLLPNSLALSHGLYPLRVIRRLGRCADHAYLLMPEIGKNPERTFMWQRQTFDQIEEKLTRHTIDELDQQIYESLLAKLAVERSLST